MIINNSIPVETLDALPVGKGAVLAKPRFHQSIRRLLEMGMTEGAPIRILRKAPFGGPFEIFIRNTRLCIRKEEAARFALSQSHELGHG